MNMLQWLMRKATGKVAKSEASAVNLTPTPGLLARMGMFAHSTQGASWTEDEAKLAAHHIQRRASNRTARESRRANRGRHAMSGHAA